MSWYYREYVPVGQRRQQALSYARRLVKRLGRDLQPVSITGKKIATTFWGKAWCEHLESYSDIANRLARGRTYVRNGSVVDLEIAAGLVEAVVAGSEPYDVTIEIVPLAQARWETLRNDCAASIDSLFDLLGGRLSAGIMERLTHRSQGLFPDPREIDMSCSCPDWAGMCKHLAAVLYGVGAHLDRRPELLFLLRGVDHQELVSQAVSADNLSTAFGDSNSDLAGEDLGAIFGIEFESETPATPPGDSPRKGKSAAKNPAPKRTAKKRTAKKKPSARPPGKGKVAKKTKTSEASASATSKPNVTRKKTKKSAAAKGGAKKKITTATKKAARQRAARKK